MKYLTINVAATSTISKNVNKVLPRKRPRAPPTSHRRAKPV
jgi:hypothetical protein